jgi:hypothetical protein
MEEYKNHIRTAYFLNHFFPMPCLLLFYALNLFISNCELISSTEDVTIFSSGEDISLISLSLPSSLTPSLSLSLSLGLPLSVFVARLFFYSHGFLTGSVQLWGVLGCSWFSVCNLNQGGSPEAYPSVAAVHIASICQVDGMWFDGWGDNILCFIGKTLQRLLDRS